MGLLDKLKFWKKKEEPFELGKAMLPELPPEIGPAPEITPRMEPRVPHPPGSLPEKRRAELELPPMAHPAMASPSERDIHKEIELVNAKLDALKATVDGIAQRVERVEKIVVKSEEKPAELTIERRWR